MASKLAIFCAILLVLVAMLSPSVRADSSQYWEALEVESATVPAVTNSPTTTSVPDNSTTPLPTDDGDAETTPAASTDDPTTTAAPTTTMIPTDEGETTPAATTEESIDNTTTTTQAGSTGTTTEGPDSTTPPTTDSPTNPQGTSPQETRAGNTTTAAPSTSTTTTAPVTTTAPTTTAPTTTKAAATTKSAATTQAPAGGKVVVKVSFKFTAGGPIADLTAVENALRAALAKVFGIPEDRLVVKLVLDSRKRAANTYRVDAELTTVGTTNTKENNAASASYVSSVFKQQLSDPASDIFSSIATSSGTTITPDMTSISSTEEIQADPGTKKKKSSNTVAIAVGVAVAGAVVIVAVAGILYFRGKNRRVSPGERMPLNA